MKREILEREQLAHARCSSNMTRSLNKTQLYSRSQVNVKVIHTLRARFSFVLETRIILLKLRKNKALRLNLDPNTRAKYNRKQILDEIDNSQGRSVGIFNDY